MYQNRTVCLDTYYVGASDRRLALFENIYPLTDGASYNSYVILDEKTCLLDTVDSSVFDIYLEKVKDVLNGRKLDYLVIHHMEPDHSAGILKIVNEFKDVTLVVNEKIKVMLENYFGKSFKNMMVVNEMDTLNLGKHTLTFVFAPMVHWPEVMVSYDSYTKTLFSADAFGTFGALSGNLFADEVDFAHSYLDEARRYYTNIVGKYGPQVQAILTKASTLEINTICPLHGPIWRKDLNYLINLYDKWSLYEPEVKGVLIVYGSIYGHTEKAANLLADALSLEGVKNIKIYDASKTDASYLVSETFKYSHLAILSSTYNMGIFTPIRNYLEDLKEHAMQNRKVAVIENGSWAPNSGYLIKKELSQMKNMTLIEPLVTIKSNPNKDNFEEIKVLAINIAKDFPKETLDSNPLFKINYGLYVLTTKDNKNNRYNGLIINTLSQVSENPTHIMVSINKRNHSATLINETKEFNVSILDKHVTYTIFKRFGYQSGRDTDKFEGFSDYELSKNNLPYLNKYSTAYLSLKVIDIIDSGSHYTYVCEITDSKLLENEDSITYSYYLENIKPKAKKPAGVKKGWICKLCGYIYEGEELPKDFICPICKHGIEVFEKIG